jgi:hypothetical protein
MAIAAFKLVVSGIARELVGGFPANDMFEIQDNVAFGMAFA